MQTLSKRKKYVDFLRLLALFYMFFQHGILMLLQENLNTGIILFLDELVPICGALFLFLSGYSLTLSKKRQNVNRINFFLKVLRRGVILIGSSSILFFLSYGFQLPDLVFSSGILNTIGWMIIICGILQLLPIKFKIIFTSIIIAAFIVFFVLLNINNILLFPFTVGYEPMIPTIIFGFLGFLLGNMEHSFNKEKSIKIFMAVLLGIGLVIFLYYAIKYPIFKVFYNDIGRYTITRQFNGNMLATNLFTPSKGVKIFYESVWNYLPKSFFATIGVVFMLFGIGFFLENFMQKYFIKDLFIPGQFAFINYFYHLFVIAVCVLIFGYNNFTLINFIVFLLLLFFGSYLLSFLSRYIKIIRSKLKT